MRSGIGELILNEDEFVTLTNWSRRRKSSQALAMRCRIVLGCADGKTQQAVADELKITRRTVGKWRRRFIESRLDGLMDEPRPGAPRTITDQQVKVKVLWATTRAIKFGKLLPIHIMDRHHGVH